MLLNTAHLSLRTQNRNQRDAIDLGQLIRSEEVPGDILGAVHGGGDARAPDDPLAVFQRFFGFKKTQRERPVERLAIQL